MIVTELRLGFLMFGYGHGEAQEYGSQAVWGDRAILRYG